MQERKEEEIGGRRGLVRRTMWCGNMKQRVAGRHDCVSRVFSTRGSNNGEEDGRQVQGLVALLCCGGR